MEIDDYRAVIAVLETGSFNGAAARLHRVPSALSARLRGLERELGCALFTKAGRGVEPTPAALELARAGRSILAISQSALSRIASNEPAGPLRIGALESLSGARMPGILAALLKAHPALELSFEAGISGTLLEGVFGGKLDAALLIDPPADPLLYRKVAFEEHLSLVAAAGHPAIRSPADLKTDTLIAFSAGCSYRERILEWFRLVGRKPGRLIEVKSYAALAACAAAGMGVAAMPDSLIRRVSDGALSVHPLPEAIARAPVEFVRLAALETPNVLAFKRILFEVTKAA